MIRIRKAAGLLVIALLLLLLPACKKSNSENKTTASAERTAASAEAAESRALEDAASASALYEGRAIDGIFIENMDISGKNETEIRQMIEQRMAEYSGDSVHLYVNDQDVPVTAGELGLTWNNTDVVWRALAVGQKGNIWDRYQVQQKIRKEGHIIFDLDMCANSDTVRGVVQTRCSVLNRSAVNMKVTKDAANNLQAIPGQDGFTVKEDASVEKILKYMDNTWHGGTGAATLDVDIMESRGEEGDLEKMNSVLGSWGTSFGDSLDGRANNVIVGTSKVNGVVLFPGETYSVIEALMPFTLENGYQVAAAIEEGRYVDDVGGGVCQVATTLYQAVLMAELEVVERFPHSQSVSYVIPSGDAAIAEGSKDFKFKNNTDAPIYVEGYCVDKNVYFTIYGHETRDPGRQVKYDYNILHEVKAPNVITLYEQLPFGSVYDLGSHDEVDAELIKIVYENGTEVSREAINRSSYMMGTHNYAVGSQGLAGTNDALLNQLDAAAATGDLNMVAAVIQTVLGPEYTLNVQNVRTQQTQQTQETQ